MLRLKQIVKHYALGENTVKALKGIDLEFRKSEFVAILGPSGCGKTTLLNIIGGLDRYTTGDLIINNRSTNDYKDADWDSYRNHSIGFVFQSYNLIPHLSVLGNVELALTLSGVSNEERKKRATKSLEDVGLADQINKKPNQLSGGQMQRVAIARALVNDPDILLADEPSGALDTETSLQIMNILKEIAKDRLIIMVTHNPDLAEQYATRTIRLLDGEVIDDSHPYITTDNERVYKKVEQVNGTQTKTSMSFLTALSLSLKNLTTKKTRTFLTAFAGSIGIIGIALVLALSNGFQTYIDKMQADTLSGYPLTIESNAIDYQSLMAAGNRGSNQKEYSNDEVVHINKVYEVFESAQKQNNLSDDYIEQAIETIDPLLYNAITYSYGVKLNIFKDVDYGVVNSYQAVSTGNWQELIEDEPYNYTFVESQYDILKGNLPTNKNEVVLVVNKFNQVTDLTLMSLGLYNPLDAIDNYSFDDLLGLEYKLILNDDYYDYNGDRFVSNSITTQGSTTVSLDVFTQGETLTVVGIIRPNPETTTGSVTGTIGYSKGLTSYVLAESLDSEIVTWMNQVENKEKNPFTGENFLPSGQDTVEELRKETLLELGGITSPTQTNIYPVDFSAKDSIKAHLDAYNTEVENQAILAYSEANNIAIDDLTKEEIETIKNNAETVFYSDIMELLVDSLNTIINVISYVLIAFTAISLVVSSIMIGIITYISVLERTKEIGVLRSIGARKKDISRVFNAETLIIGFTSGLIGIVVTLVLSIPINIILANLVEIKGLASLNPIHAIVLILISMFLTVVAGLIPSRIAAKKDPVIALRTE